MTARSVGGRAVHGSEDRSIAELCAFLALHDRCRVAVICRPDRRKGGEGQCDAILARGVSQVAVEHTRVYGSPRHPGKVRILEQVRGTIQTYMTQAFPHSAVMVGVPVECFTGGMDWPARALELAEGLVDRLRVAPANHRVAVDMRGTTGRAFAQVIGGHRDFGFCSVHPVVWEREPEDLTVDDFRRALADKLNGMQSYKDRGAKTLLLLEFDAMASPPWALEQLRRAAGQADISAYDEIFLSLSAWTPAFVLPFLPRLPEEQAAAICEEYIQLHGAVELLLAAPH